MLSRYIEIILDEKGNLAYRLRCIAPYNIELIARNPALKIQKKSFYSMTSVLRCQLQPARINKCQTQNANPIDSFRRFPMDLEFNIIGFWL